ncbi:hypothetical protein KEM60_00756 [Austwickia sp. TVS 96-490-7B]|uniref:ATP-grasp fold amidoligase family protein n=1 Tax=Austwickia sp. TVS 96-490-7B TaxID=2830843 RepID=UPI001C56F7E6|nr:ATP-grasp fold amidoligase family protein [Austwickia sp. TVS 96-490-7B]MBW3084568.1 hypothetical protein [Austwickia sp. TVS 96-490-7B]
MPDVVVGIPTYHRPEGLRRLLRSLRPEIHGRAAVIIADNGCRTDTTAIADSELSSIPHLVIPVPQSGVSQARNALIDTAISRFPQWQWLMMLDDDGWVTPGWLDHLLKAGLTYNADLIGGVVDQRLSQHPSRIVRNSPAAEMSPFPTGLVPHLAGAQNIGIRRRIVDDLPAPWFDPKLGQIGSEDTDFFTRVSLHGGILAWSAEAVVVEPVPTARLSPKMLLKRAYHANTVNAHVALKHHDPQAVRHQILSLFPHLGRNVIASVIRRDPDRLIRTGFAATGLAGRINGYLEARIGARFAWAQRHSSRHRTWIRHQEAAPLPQNAASARQIPPMMIRHSAPPRYLNRLYQRARSVSHQLAGPRHAERVLRERFRAYYDRDLDVDHAKLFTEKLFRRMILMARRRDTGWLPYIDTLALRDHVTATVGAGYALPVLWRGTRADDIPFETLPRPCVLKSTQGCGQHFVLDGSEDPQAVVSLAHGWSGQSPQRENLEFYYYDIPRMLYIEPFLNDGFDDGPLGYYFYTFNGKVTAIQIGGRLGDVGIFYDVHWEKLPFLVRSVCRESHPPRPHKLAEMISIAERLGADHDFVRVDLYYVDDHIYVGKMTFIPANGWLDFNPAEWDKRLGELWQETPGRL